MRPRGRLEDPFDLDGGLRGGFQQGGAPTPANLPQPGTDYPTGEFDAHDPKWTTKPPTVGPPGTPGTTSNLPNIDVWAHDDTVKAGKTYRYRMTYKMRNPIYGGQNVAVDQKLSETFAITSKPSEWSTPVHIPELVNYFVQSSKSLNSNTVRFDVFRWDKGQQKQETFTVGPGDIVGGTKNGVDFSTSWTLVDFRFDDRQNDTQILLMNNVDGQLIARSYKADRDDALYKGLLEQVKQVKDLEAANAAATGTPVPGVRPPGARPPGGGTVRPPPMVPMR
jgi:hypothetical protein